MEEVKEEEVVKERTKSAEEREIEVQKEMDRTLIREIEYLLAFLAFVFIAYLVHVINLISKPPS